MAGIYFHIPFCTRFCRYCDFYSETKVDLIDRFVGALKKEISYRREQFNSMGVPITSIYFGGGTPSLLSPYQIGEIIEELSSISGIELDSIKEMEVTIEMNPDDITLDYLKSLKNNYVNRISIGVQSFIDLHLDWMYRRHNSQKAVDAFYMAREAGFDNISLDLIFGFSQLTDQDLKYNIEKLLSLSPEHISTYQLSIEKSTQLYKDFSSGRYSPPTDYECNRQYYIIKKQLESGGYFQYEISNYSKEGYRAIHNSSYWDHSPYLGFGPSAHSFIANRRFWVESDLLLYLKTIEDSSNSVSKLYQDEILSDIDLFNEFVMLSLRVLDGVNYNTLIQRCPKEFEDQFKLIFDRLLHEGDLVLMDGHIKIPSEKLFVSDGIISSLFIL